MKCPKCQAKVEDNDDFCPECGTKLKFEKTQEEVRTTGFAKASLTLGILGIILFIIPFLSLLAIIFGIIALVRVSQNRSLLGKGMAIAGIILGIIKWLAVFLIIKNMPRIIIKMTPVVLEILKLKL